MKQETIKEPISNYPQENHTLENVICQKCQSWEKMLSNNNTGFCRNPKSNRNGFLKLSNDYCHSINQ